MYAIKTINDTQEPQNVQGTVSFGLIKYMIMSMVNIISKITDILLFIHVFTWYKCDQGEGIIPSCETDIEEDSILNI